MSKFITQILKFLVVAIAAYIVFVVVWAEVDYDSFIKKNEWYELKEAGIDSLGNVNSYGHMFTRLKEVKEAHDVDLLIIGGSQAYRGFDTRIFKRAGYFSFNLGSSNQTPLQSEILMKRYLDQLNPKKVVYVVYPEVFEVDGVESSLDLLANDKVDISMSLLVLKQKNFKLLNTLIYTSYRQVFGLNNKFSEKRQKQDDTYISGGYVEKKLSHFKKRTYPTQEWEFNKDQIRAFERSLSMFKRKNIEYILIQPPTVSSYYESFTNNNEFDRLMNNYGTYYNANDKVELDDSIHFYDPFHLNQLGVEIFDDKILSWLGQQ